MSPEHEKHALKFCLDRKESKGNSKRASLNAFIAGLCIKSCR